MKVVARCIYYKPVTPSCDIVEMDEETWRAFLYAKNKRRLEIILKLTGKEYMEGYVRELAWIPLDENMKLSVKKLTKLQYRLQHGLELESESDLKAAQKRIDKLIPLTGEGVPEDDPKVIELNKLKEMVAAYMKLHHPTEEELKARKEKIEKYKADVIDAIMASPIDPHAFPKDYREREAEAVKNSSDKRIIAAMRYHTPEDYADLLLM